MSLQSFSFPVPETRLLRAEELIHMFKIRGGSFSGEELKGGSSKNQELTEIIRTVLGNLDNLQPFSSTNFTVFPYKRRWQGLSQWMCKHEDKKLRAYPYILILYLEKNAQTGKQAQKRPSLDKEREQNLSVSELESKRRKRDLALEDAVLQNLRKELEAESKMHVARRPLFSQRAEAKVTEDTGHADEMKPGGCLTSEGSGEAQCRNQQETGEEEDEEEEEKEEEEEGEEDEEEGEEEEEEEKEGEEEEGEEEEEEGEEEEGETKAPGGSGFLTRLTRRLFPFSVFFRDQ